MAGRLKIFTCIIVNPGLNWTFYIPHGLFFLCGETFYCAEGDRIFFFLLSSWLCLLPDFLRLRSAHWHLRSIFGLMGPMPKFVRPDSRDKQHENRGRRKMKVKFTFGSRGSRGDLNELMTCARRSTMRRFASEFLTTLVFLFYFSLFFSGGRNRVPVFFDSMLFIIRV